ncbi:MAG: ABC-F family ATP-binding cassette domain-containing protein [Pseudomonadota bacterium]
MATPPILAVTDLKLAFGGKPLFTGVEFTLSLRERIALVGRNGAGKSTLMKIVDGRIEPDTGDVWRQPGLRIVTVEQEPKLDGYASVLDFILDDPQGQNGEDRLDLETARHRAEAEIMELGLQPTADPKLLSGGQQRRAALAKAFAADPDILLLDEPTNHLDVPMIKQLETRLNAFRGAVLLVSHDRAFLEAVSTNTLWLRQGIVLKSPRGYAHFEDWAESIEAEEEKTLARLRTKLKDEQRWLARGVTARRKRNMGRLDRLKTLRAEHARRKSALGQARAGAKLETETNDVASRKIIDVRGISKSFNTPGGELQIADNLSIRILRGDRIGIIGPNGVGKTTLLKLLLKELAPDSGSVKLAKVLDINYLDQTRETLAPKDTIWEALAPNGGDSIMVQDTPRHVGAYAKDFLFGSDQLRQPVGALSGGERNRLTLAIALARKCDLLVLDEPTNDLDMQTLDLLEDMLERFAGTLIIVSHDRSFLDNTVTSCLSPVGAGKWIETPGGWTDAQRQLKDHQTTTDRETPGKSRETRRPTQQKTSKEQHTKKLTYKDTYRLKELDTLIPRLTEEIASLEKSLSDPMLYSEDLKQFEQNTARLGEAKAELDAAESEWLELEEKREEIETARSHP